MTKTDRQRGLFEMDERKQKQFGQYFTPRWLANAIIGRYFSGLGRDDVVCEPSCGLGAFLNAVPSETTAFGVDVDQVVADQCRTLTGRRVIVGRFEEVDLPHEPTAIIGNPPFAADTIDAFLDRSHQVLPDGGVVGFILPAYMLQTAGRVVRYASRWSISTEMIPRNVYEGLSKPLVFSLFRKGRDRTLVGMAFYFEAADVDDLPKPIKAIFKGQGGGLWPEVIEKALIELGGKGSLQDIYRVVEGNRPTSTAFWREQIRKVLRSKFIRVGEGQYAHPSSGYASATA